MIVASYPLAHSVFLFLHVWQNNSRTYLETLLLRPTERAMAHAAAHTFHSKYTMLNRKILLCQEARLKEFLYTVADDPLEFPAVRNRAMLEWWLDQVDTAYGQPAKSFRGRVAKAWKDIKRNWPREGTPERTKMDLVFHNLCTHLECTRHDAQAQQWPERDLQRHLTNLLVCSTTS